MHKGRGNMNKKLQFKKILSVLISLILVFSLVLPLPVFAAGEPPSVCQIGDTQYGSLDEALNVVDNGETITLLADISDTNGLAISSGKSFTINLNNYTLDVTNSGDLSKAVEVTNGSAVAITGAGSFNASGEWYGVYADNATVTVSSAASSMGTAVFANNRANVTVTGNAAGAGTGIYARNTSVVTVAGDVGSANNGASAIDAQGSTILVHGNVTASGGGSSHGILGAGNITVDGDVEGNQIGVEVSVVSSIINIGGNVTARGTDDADNSFFCYGALASDGKINITGNITATGGTGVRSVGSGKLTIDGTITAAHYIEFGFGGTKTVKSIEDKEPVTTKPGYYTYAENSGEVWVKEPILPEPVCQIGATGYATLDEALAAVGAGQEATIVLLDDINYDNGIVISSGQGITFDLNNHTLNVVNSSGYGLDVTNGYVEYINEGLFNVTGYHAGVRAKGNNASATVSSATSAWANGNGAFVTEGGHIVVNGNVQGGYNGVLVTQSLLSGQEIYVSTAVINGDAKGTASDSSGARADSGGSITINGGTAEGVKYGAYANGREVSVSSTVTITGGNAIGTGSSSHGVHTETYGTVTVDGNVQGTQYGISAGQDTEVAVTGNVTATADVNGYGVNAESGASVNIGGNVVANGSSLGVYASSSEVIVDGAVLASNYIRVYDNVNQTNVYKDGSEASRTTPTTKEGYYTYSAGNSSVWVKAVPDTPQDNVPPSWPSFSSLIPTNITGTSVALKWRPATDNVGVDGYKIYLDGAGGEEELTTLAGDANTYEVTGLVANTSYTFRIEAFDGAGNISSNGPETNIRTVVDWAHVLIMPADPNDPAQPHYSYNGHLTTFKAVLRGIDPDALYYYRWDVDGDGNWDQLEGKPYAILDGKWYQGKGTDLSGKAYLPDIDSESELKTAVVQVTTAVVNGQPDNPKTGYYPVLQFGNLSSDNPDQLSNEELRIMRNIAMDDALWYLHQNFVRNSDSGPGATGYINEGNNKRTNTALYLLALAENGRYPAYPAGYNLFDTDELNDANDALYDSDPYAEDALRAVNYLLNSLSEMQVPEIDKSDDGGNRITGSEDYSGLYIVNNIVPEDNCSSLALAALAKSRLAGSKAVAANNLVQGLPFELIIQRMVDAGVASQVDENNAANALGGWTYTPAIGQVVNPGGINSIISGAWIYALHAAEEEMGGRGVYVNNRLKNRLANNLYYAQNTADGGPGYSNLWDFSVFSVTGNYLLGCKWLGWDKWDPSDESDAGYPYIQLTKGQARQVYDRYLQYVITNWENSSDSANDYCRYYGGYLWTDGNYNGAVRSASFAGTAASNLRHKSMAWLKNAAESEYMTTPIQTFGNHEWEREFAVSLIKGQHSSGRYAEENGTFDYNDLGSSGFTAYAAMAGGSSYTYEIPELIITTTSLAEATTTLEYTAALNAAGGLGEYTWNVSGLPEGLYYDYRTGVISGIPESPGTYTVYISVTDGVSTAETTIELVVNPGGLKIETVSSPVWIAGAPYSFAVEAAGGITPYAWAAENLPLGLAMDAATGTISGIPIVAGEYTVTVSVSDNDGASVEKDITMKVNTYRTLIISTSTLPAAHISEAYSATLEADGGKAPYSWSASGLPEGLSIDPGTGIITGVPVNDGTYNVSITVEDSLGTSKEAQYELSVRAVRITTSELPDAIWDVNYSAQLEAVGGEAPYTWSVTTIYGPGMNEWPRGISLDESTGELSGEVISYYDAGSYLLQFRATDANGNYDEKELELWVYPGTVYPRVTNESVPVGTLGEPYSVTMVAKGGVQPYIWSARLPDGLAIDGSTGVISGIPEISGLSSIDVTVANGDLSQASSSHRYDFYIVEPLEVSTMELPQGEQGEGYCYTLQAAGGMTPWNYEWEKECLWRASGLPEGLSINEETGIIYGIPAGPGVSVVSIHVTDRAGNEAAKDLELVIQGGVPINDFACTGKTDATATFSFSAPAGAAVVTIRQSSDGGMNWTDSITSASLTGTSTTAIVTGLSQNTAYKFKLVVTGGSHAGDSNIVDVKTAAKEPPTSDLPSGGGGGIPPVSERQEARILDPDGNVSGTLNLKLDGKTGNALVDIDSDSLKDAFDKSKTNKEGVNIIEVDLPEMKGAVSYEVILPSSFVSSGDAGKAVAISTHIGTVTVPGNMLEAADAGNSRDVSLTVAEADTSKLDKDTRLRLEGKPVIELSLKLDGKPVSWKNEKAPVTVTIPYKPTEEELKNPESIVVWYIDGSGNLVSVPNGRYDPVTGTVVFNVTHFSNYAVGYNKVSFKDVASDAWYYKAVSFIAARDITTGTGNGNFSPEAKLTRGEFIVLMMRAYGITPDTNPEDNFADAGNAYYTGYLAAAKRLGIAAGMGNNMYAPGNQITRQEMFTLLYSALKVIGQLPGIHGRAVSEADDQLQGDSGKTLDQFTDAGDIAPWAVEAMKLLVETGTVSGSNGKLNPTGTTTRAQMAQVLYNLLSK